MADIVTVTLNPAVDLFTSASKVAPVHKIRCEGQRRDPGGGGLNVARAACRLGADVEALYTAGGVMGQVLYTLMEREGVPHRALSISGDTRENVTVDEAESGAQYRFVMPGPELRPEEWGACQDAIAALDPFPDYLVASGSLPPGAPGDAYARLADLARAKGARFVVDTSGPALEAALEAGVYLVKPSMSELAAMTGQDPDDSGAAERACARLVAQGKAGIVALTLGGQGAVLAAGDRLWRAPAVEVEASSAVGAGDCFLGAMVWSLAAGAAPEEAFRWAMAAGAAALASPGTELCQAETVRSLAGAVQISEIPA